MKSVDIKCDTCGADLADAGAMPSYRLELQPQAIPNSGSIIYDVYVTSDINRSHHFCGLACLGQWMHEHHPTAQEQYAKMMAHRARMAERQRS